MAKNKKGYKNTVENETGYYKGKKAKKPWAMTEMINKIEERG